MAENGPSRDGDLNQWRLNLISFLWLKAETGKASFKTTKKIFFIRRFNFKTQFEIELLGLFTGPRNPLKKNPEPYSWQGGLEYFVV